MKFHSCPFFTEWKRSALFLLLKNKDKTVFWEFCFQASLLHSPSTEEKRVPLLQPCILEEPKSIHSSPFENFSRHPLSPHVLFSAYVQGNALCWLAEACVTGPIAMVMRMYNFKESPPFPEAGVTWVSWAGYLSRIQAKKKGERVWNT